MSSEMDDRQWNDHLALLWANKERNGTTWDGLLDLHAARYASRWIDANGIVAKLLDKHQQQDCRCYGTAPDRDCKDGYCEGCGSFWPCETIKIIDEGST